MQPNRGVSDNTAHFPQAANSNSLLGVSLFARQALLNARPMAPFMKHAKKTQSGMCAQCQAPFELSVFSSLPFPSSREYVQLGLRHESVRVPRGI